MQRALRSVALQMTPPLLADQARLTAFVAGQPVLATIFSSVFVVGSDGRMQIIQD
jgi:hypothetical protein